MRRLNSKLMTNFVSEKGSDPVHKTYVAYTPLDHYMCIAVSESYDNDIDINSAKLAVETVLTEFEKNPSFKKIKSYMKAANEQILLHSTKNKLKVSITVIVSDYTRMRYGVCGNTKIHVFYENMISFISETQTKFEQLQETVDVKDLDNEEIHNLTQYLGISNTIRPFISRKISLIENSTILVSTSNFWGLVSDIELLDAYENAKENEELLDSAQELLLSRQNTEEIGSYTAAVILVEKTFKEDTQKIKKRKKLLIVLSVILISISIIVLIVILSIRAMDRNKMSKIEEYEKRGTQYIEYENYSKSLVQYEKADELAQKLSLNNWQYKKKKKLIKDGITDKVTLLTTIQDGETALKEKSYEEAKNLFTEIKEQAKNSEDSSIYEYASELLKEINIQLEVEGLIAVGDMYESTEDHEKAMELYNEALEIIKETTDLETRKAVQLKIYDITQILKEIEKTEETEKEKQKEEEAKKEDENVKKQIIKIQVLLSSANKYLAEGKTAEAKKVHKKILAVYNAIATPSEEVIKLYSDIVTLEQAISEAEVKKAEDETNQKIQKAQEYIMEAAEAAQKGSEELAIQLYEKALTVYKNLKLWNDQVEKIYEDIQSLREKMSEEANTAKSDESK